MLICLSPLRLAAAFTAVVTSFVSDILLPILSLLPFIDRNFDEKFAVLKAGPHYGKGPGRGYNTMKIALEDGAVIMSWGYVFLSQLSSKADLATEGMLNWSRNGLILLISNVS